MVRHSAPLTDDLNNTGFHQYWIQTSMYSTAKDFIQQKVNQTRSTSRYIERQDPMCNI